MRIVSYTSTDAPPRMAAAARIINAGGMLLPVVFHAPDEKTARAKAKAFYDAAMARAQDPSLPPLDLAPFVKEPPPADLAVEDAEVEEAI